MSNSVSTGEGRSVFPKNARKYIPVGLGRAIPGAPRFWKDAPALSLINLFAGPKLKKQVGRIRRSRNPTYGQYRPVKFSPGKHVQG